jgi:MOSC domain-containing protein
VCEWFPGLTVDDVRLRFRASLEIDGVPAFWEDRLFGEAERSVVRFHIGEVAFEGSNPCARCPVPPRDPLTGVVLDGFQKRFTQLRESTLPPWSPRARFDHFYRFTTNTRVASSQSGLALRVGDDLAM